MRNFCSQVWLTSRNKVDLVLGSEYRLMDVWSKLLRFWNGGEGVSTSLNEVFQSRKNLNSSLKQLAGARAAECWE